MAIFVADEGVFLDQVDPGRPASHVVQTEMAATPSFPQKRRYRHHSRRSLATSGLAHGLMLELIPGSDRIPRVANLHTATGLARKSINRLIRLPVPISCAPEDGDSREGALN
ncbi:hypothetical protein AVEN_66112-1 [Araneus ventricosus]|uniref:Uncharacterized protein n=1 Tax=Araneus ventricosus TaxID=182803 RepID=A0A4Y2G3T7_ARAVE|nr:hypothetical protein AVEN_66112-1 [Araneus ventricosus]